MLFSRCADLISRATMSPAVTQWRGGRFDIMVSKRRRYPAFIEGGKRQETDYGKVRCSLTLSQRPKKPQRPLFPEDPDAPVLLEHNPYERALGKCLLCDLGVKLDYKNARLLQQFVSSFSGRVYDRHITGLCNRQHSAVVRAIALSRRAGYMPVMTKDIKYLKDPKLFDPLRPIRPHSYDE